MQRKLLFILSLTLISCASRNTEKVYKDSVKEKYANEINGNDLREHLYLLSSDVLEGRRTGEKGQKMAVNYMTAYYEHIGLEAPVGHTDYLQHIPKAFFNNTSPGPSENVLAYIEGSEFPEEVVIISAHYDHLGKDGELIFNGADDNASGTSALMEIAESFQIAKNQGNGPKRSILFLHFTGEELGLYGSKYYVKHPVFSLDNTVVDLNIDMVGRVDNKHKTKPEYIYLIGADKISMDLHKLSEQVNKRYTGLKLDYSLNGTNDPNRFYYRSDHYNFAEKNIPVIFYFNGEHEDYHQSTDTADKINFDILEVRTKLVFYTAWEIANRNDRLKLDAK